MFRSLAPAFVVAALVVAVPAHAQSSEDWQYLFDGQPALLSIEVGPNAVLAELHDITASGDYARDARLAIDNFQGVGNGDGTVSEQEVVTFEAYATVAINENLPTTFDHDLVKLDGRTPLGLDGNKAIEMVKVDIKGAEGSVDSTEPIKTDLRVKLIFDEVDQRKTTHSVEFTNVYGDFTSYSGSEVPPVSVQISAFGDWAIVSNSVQPAEAAARLQGDTLTFTNEDFTYFESAGSSLFFEVQGDPSDQVVDNVEGAPGVGPMVFLGALGAAMVALRRRF